MRPAQTDNQLLYTAQQAHTAGRLGEAANTYQLILQTNPNNAEAWHLLGVLHSQTGDANAAVEFINKALALEPLNPTYLFNLGCVFLSANAPQQATLSFTQAVRLDTTNVKAWAELGKAFFATQNYPAALRALENGIVIDPLHEPLHDQICRIYKHQSNFEACLESADRGLEVIPESPRLWIHRADVCFALGHFDQAWEAYEWRFKMPENPNTPPDFPLEQWHGQNLADKSILVWTEQGPGDTFLFSSLLQDIIEQAGTCTVATTERLQPILARSFPEIEVLDGAELKSSPETADFQTSLISAGRWLRKSWSDFKSRPAHIRPDPQRKERLAESIKPGDDNRPVVGIAWRSFGVEISRQKSIALDAWRPILSVPGIKFISLQYGDATKDIEDFKTATGVEIISGRVPDPISDLEGHLALIASMDLIISSSNTAVHAAAAQGVPVWCAVPHTLGEGLRWSWFTDRQDSPWYPSVKLYRQDVREDWTLAVAQIAVDLAKWSKEKGVSVNLEQHFLALTAAYHQVDQPKAYALTAEAALEENPDLPSAYRYGALGHLKLGNYENAVALLNEALARNSNDVDLLIDRSNALGRAGLLEEAETDLQNVLSQQPGREQALYNLGNIRASKGYSRQALKLYQTIDENAASHIDTKLKLAIASRLSELGRIEECKTILMDMIQRNEEAVEAASRLAMGLLMHGVMAEGWSYLRHRLAKQEANIHYGHFPFPVWSGESIVGKHVLVWTEQGIGEEILVATMMGELSKQAKSVTLLCTARLVSLFKSSLHGVRVALRDEPLPQEALDPRIDVQMSFSDVGHYLRPTLESFPKKLKTPTLKANVSERRNLAKRYRQSVSKPFLVGLSWHSSAPDYGVAKSIAPELFANLVRKVPAQFVSLQYDAKTEHLDAFKAFAPERWTYDSSVDPLLDMERPASQIAALDFVVTISNTTAHLAGALGIPTILLVAPHAGRHWYWFKKHTTCLWYPSVEIFEVEESMDWSVPLRRVQERLQGLTKDL